MISRKLASKSTRDAWSELNGLPIRHYQCSFCFTMNNVINSFGNEMFWGANQIQTGKLSNTKDYNW